jgi:SsrA-binding protein
MKLEIKNRKAKFSYNIIDTYVAGIVLTGTEIKSVRASKVSFNDSYCMFVENELWLKNLHISVYENGTYSNHEPKRDRKLLLTKKELKKLKETVSEKGLTIIPLKLFLNKKNFCKVEIALAKGKQTHDKRNTIKKKDVERENDRKF